MFRRRTSDVTVADLAAAHGEGALTVDVREPDEFVGGHVPGAVNIPLGQLGSRLGDLPPTAHEGTVFVICATGNRSQAGADLLTHQGMDARSVAGGTVAWERAGHPVVRGDGS